MIWWKWLHLYYIDAKQKEQEHVFMPLFGLVAFTIRFHMQYYYIISITFWQLGLSCNGGNDACV